ncbi:MAG: hypothetical protein DRI81_07465 [Chloroflexi bacterium]|nr:MAG: hypothetical protein DRI81_07465 [Chloroflexota bacterium]
MTTQSPSHFADRAAQAAWLKAQINTARNIYSIYRTLAQRSRLTDQARQSMENARSTQAYFEQELQKIEQ